MYDRYIIHDQPDVQFETGTYLCTVVTEYTDMFSLKQARTYVQ